jgi:bile acid:Na+ symporter, BASS family
MNRFRQLIEKHFSLVLLLSSVAGLVVPGLPLLPNETAIITLALLMFVSCYRLRDGDFKAIRWGSVTTFYILRYVLLPFVLWFITYLIAPNYAICVLLLTALPAATSSPAITNIYGGGVASAFVVVILSQMATPFVLPLQFAWLREAGFVPETQIIPPPVNLFITMVWCIFVPMAAYLFTRKHKPSADYIYAQTKWLSTILVAFIIALAIAKQRDVILSDGAGFLIAFLVSLGCYVIYMLFGWHFSRKLPDVKRITFTTCSTFNNAILGVSLALMHFGPDVVLFVAVSEMAWSTLPTMVGFFLRRKKLVA